MKYVTPELEIISFSGEEVLTASQDYKRSGWEVEMGDFESD